jgi:predicted ATP-grasp superfamily ATP-dependent carboligase
MKIAVLEHFTAQPAGMGSSGSRAEGGAMRDAVVADLRRLPGLSVEIVDRRRMFRSALRRADAALVIAPEEDGILEGLARAVEREGRILLGPAPAAVRLMADKLATARCLEAAGVPTPRTEVVRFGKAARQLRSRALPFVLKPRDGCGCRGVAIVRHRHEIAAAIRAVRRATRRADFLAQDHVAGESVSVSVISSPGLLSLGLNHQRIRKGNRPAYEGGETMYPHRLAPLAFESARAAIRAIAAACPGVRGYAGVDLVLGDQGATVIEINPRLTTSYVGLRHSFDVNIAGLIVDAALGRPLPARLTSSGSCRFRPDGRILHIAPHDIQSTEKGSEWPTIAAGTSAAFI